MTTRTGVRTPLLLRRLLDDAAIFPPGNAPMPEALHQHEAYGNAWYAGIVGRFVCTTQRLPELIAALPADVAVPLDLTLVVPSGVRAVGPAVEEVTHEPRIALRAVDVPASAGDLAATLHGLDDLSLDVPAYLELPLSCDLEPLQGTRHRVKFRTGGVIVGSVPSSGLLAMALHEVVAKGLPFKLTAGLHHAVAGPDQHGFANILVAVHAALDGRPVEDLAGVLALQDGDLVASLLRALSLDECRRVRQLFVSFGTCSIREPLADLVSRTADPGRRMTSWVDVPEGNGFTIDALPYGSFTAPGLRGPRVGVAIGAQVLDLTEATAWMLPDDAALFACGTLDTFLAAGRPAWDRIRDELQHWLADEHHRVDIEPLLRPARTVTMQLPFTVADYVDFYASEVHATNLGRMFRPDGDPLTPNWKHLPIGYHGRAGTVVVSGTPVRRPRGQRRTAEGITVGPSLRLDVEAELGYVVGVPSEQGTPVALDAFDEHVFGVCLVNDWSARDLQAWEYVPLGPFLGKSFATSISPWVLPLSALSAARVPAPSRDVPLQAYLDDASTPPWGLDLELSITLNGTTLSCPSYREMYWTGAQMLAHLTVNGASLRTGDLFASGTVSSLGPRRQGSLIELSGNGSEPVLLDDGSTRGFLDDGDEVVIAATAPGASGGRISLGEVRGIIVP